MASDHRPLRMGLPLRRLRHLILGSAMLVMAATVSTGPTAGFGAAAAASADAPPPRYSMALAEDANGHAVLFGGIGSGYVYLGDTWTWDGATWTRQHPPT